MLKRIARLFLTLILSILCIAVLYIGTMQVTEFRPETETSLELQNNLSDDEMHYVGLNEIIKILTFNIGYASLSATEDFAMDGGTKGHMDNVESVEANLEGIDSILTSQAADIVLLQEVDEESHRSFNTLQYTRFQSLLGMPNTLGINYRALFVPFPFTPSEMMGKVNSGIASFTNYYASEATRIQLPGEFSWPIRLANLKRCLVVTRLPIRNSEKELVVINLHLSAYDDGAMRLQEMAALQAILSEEYALGNYVVAGGDFNQTFPGAYTVTLDADNQAVYDYQFELKDPTYWQAFGMDSTWFDTTGFQFGVEIGFANPTCRLLHQAYDTENPDHNQYYYIDGFIVSPNVQILTVNVINDDFRYSDHNPVVMQFKLSIPE